MSWETVIGLEIHVQLNTNSKIFSGGATQFGAMPNTQACAIDLGMPGVLPVLNEATLHKAIKFGLAVGAHINRQSVFARKNYFYPDLPKGYQISQHEYPIVGAGKITITLDNGEEKTIGITRAHLEEDAGKSLHEDFQGKTGVDLNRAGVPLLEIVSEPDLRCAKDAITYLKTMHALVRYLEISDGNMQEGSFRCDANVSVCRPGDPFGTRTELKNLNSFRFIERAIDYEVQRQIEVLENGGQVLQETRLYDTTKNITRAMRSKEEAHDYRYFPDPDLLPVVVEEDYIDNIRQQLPELPWEKRQRFMVDYQLNDYDARILVSSRELADYYEAVIENSKAEKKLIANWVIGDLLGALKKAELPLEKTPVSPSVFAGLLNRIADNTISGKIAKTVFEMMWQDGLSADDVIEREGLKQVTDTSAIEKMIDDVIANSPQQLAQYRAGKEKLFGYFVGQVMKVSKGKANPAQVNQLLKSKLAG
jgi:aspartyl-tRNA(Asn)/glutamyl-tRNA(Gln) amidotransferase subunit B